ncbi:unnamed protein product [marine sediment metagenome]|uniref:Uncharacterized protein n=1 Tax=marine sediment metagenome TaxID=412755 RepID=X1BGC9_9ZZZZ
MKRQEYDHSKIEGNDADIETSLKEYGLAWIETDTEYLFYYGIRYDDNEGEHDRFDFASFDKNLDIKEEFNWVCWKAINSYIGINIDNESLVHQISDLLSYHGYENIFGSSYWEGLTYKDIINVDINHLIDTYNEYETVKMAIVETEEEYYTLYIGKNEITEGDTIDLTKRIKQINRENGYDY